MPIVSHALKDVPVISAPSGAATPKPWTPNFYHDLDTEFESFAGHVLIAEHHFTEDWPTWEMHPKGDEIVYLLGGAAEFAFWVEGREEVVTFDKPGSYVVVPKGTWHTARTKTESRMLFFTPGEGTENAERPR